MVSEELRLTTEKDEKDYTNPRYADSRDNENDIIVYIWEITQ